MIFDRETHTVHADGRVWRADPRCTDITDHDLSAAVSTMVHYIRRCITRFESGWAASIIWGSGTYSSNNNAWHDGDPFTETPTTVEVGVLDHHGELRGDPHAYVDDAMLADILDTLATLPTNYDYGPVVDHDKTMADMRAAIETIERLRNEVTE